MMLSGFCLCEGLVLGKNECFGYAIDLEVGEITVERFDSLSEVVTRRCFES